MNDSEEHKLVTDAIENGVDAVRKIADYFARLVGQSTSSDELHEHGRRLSSTLLDIFTHLVNSPHCQISGQHLATAAAITEFFSEPLMSNACCGETFAVFKERTIRSIHRAMGRRVESMRGEKSVQSVTALVRTLREVEVALAQQEVTHGATRH